MALAPEGATGPLCSGGSPLAVCLLNQHCAFHTAQAKDLEAKLDAQTKRTQEAVAKADAARSALKTSASAIATLEAQLAGLQVRLCPLTLPAAAHQ
jgi:hypothetical protein